MNKLVSSKILENDKLLNHFMEQSYWIKTLNRNPHMFNAFYNEMKSLYKERVSDKIGSAMDNIDMVSSVLSVLK